MMKKIYSTILFVFAFCALLSAQIINDNYTDASYDATAVQADLTDHADWFAGHQVPNGPPTTKTWSANNADQIKTQSNFAFAIHQTPIMASNGDVLTFTIVTQFGNNPQIFNAGDANKQLYLTGLSPFSSVAPGDVGNTIGPNRDGVLVRSDGPGAKVFMTAEGAGVFGTNPEISTVDKAAYEIIIEYTIGADAASSSKVARIRNLSSNETSPIESASGMNSDTYTALTGSGAYFLNWGLGFVVSGEINIIYNNRLEVGLNAPLLSTSEHNAFEFAMYPNPVNDRLYINTQESINKIEAYDLLGKTVLIVNEVNDYINVSSLGNSIYILKLTSDKGVSIKRFIKE